MEEGIFVIRVPVDAALALPSSKGRLLVVSWNSIVGVVVPLPAAIQFPRGSGDEDIVQFWNEEVHSVLGGQEGWEQFLEGGSSEA